MKRSKSTKLIAGVAAVPVIALVAAGCGGGGGDDSAAASAPPKTASSQAATISTAGEGNLGTILVDSRGRTLYLFEKDTRTKSACYGACASAWPPLRDSEKPTVDSGLSAALVGTTTRSDGKPQVTYNGHPLYLFSGDQAAGDTNGQGSSAFGAGWFALSPAGDEISGEASSSGGGSDPSDSGYGGGY